MRDKLGFYTCDGIRFESKIKAMIYANPLRKDIQWHFNDEVFLKYDWTKEPELSLDQLYDARARQIREQFDYVILSYSGGSDSNNILESFIRQNLHIDEVVTNWVLDASEKFLDLSGDQRSSWNNNAEFRLHTTARLQYIKDKCPRTKITVNDTSKALLNGLMIKDDPSWVEARNDVVNVTGISNYNVTFFKDIRKTFDKFQRIAFVIGTDKPKVKLIDNEAYLFFIDKAVNMVALDEHIQEYPNATPVFFYWDPDSADVLCKQAHTVLKYLRANPQLESLWRRTDVVAQRKYQEEILKFLVYPSTWSSKYWQVNKTTKDWDSELDFWFTRGWAGTREHDIWFNGLKTLAPKINTFIIRGVDGGIHGSRPYFSPNYHIGSLK